MVDKDKLLGLIKLIEDRRTLNDQKSISDILKNAIHWGDAIATLLYNYDIAVINTDDFIYCIKQLLIIYPTYNDYTFVVLEKKAQEHRESRFLLATIEKYKLLI